MHIPTNKWGKLLLSFVLFSLISGLIASRPALTSRAASSAQSDWKEKLVTQMNEAEANIARLKQALAANPKDTSLRDQLNAALSQYDQLSAQMGGDRAAPAEGKGGAGSLPRGGPLGGIGVVPTAPTGCTVTTTNTVNSTPVAIPTGPAVVSSTITVAGAGTYLWDLNMQTFITHTFAADLDITLQSPAGTIVTITTDNGASNDNVFNGTVWDDQANPGGQVPYTTNAGLVTDHPYVNLVTATPLVPEEALAAFRGENPNGTWTLTISDDLAGDGGSLDSWQLEVSTLSAAPTETTTSATNSTPLAIPTGPAVVSNTVVIAGAGAVVSKVTLMANITHTFAADLDITIASPSGTVVTLTTDNGAGNDNVFNGTLWDDDANPGGQVPYTTNAGMTTDHPYANLTVATPLTPEEALGAFNGQNPNGTWTITISDDLAGDGGSLDSWTLNVTTAVCGAACTLTCPANLTVANDPNQCGAVVNYPAPTTTGSCGPVICTPAIGSFFPVGTTTVTCSSSVAGNTTTVYSSGNIAVPIPDNNPTGASSTITVPATDTGPVTDVNVRVRINHTRDADLAIGLGHANSGNALSNNNGGAGDNYGMGANDCSGTKTIFDDSAGTPISAGSAPFAGTFQPQSGLTIYNGSPNDGAWTLGVVDSAAAETGTIFCWELETTRQATTMCAFTVTVLDTQPPTITCPANQTAVTDQNVCPPPPCTAVNFPAPTVTDNCPGATVVCNPPSGGCLPVGVTTVTCTATDASGNTATCSFAVSVFDTILQDDSNPANELLWNSLTGAYRFCCNGIVFTGVGKALRQGCIFTLDHTSGIDRRVLGRVDKAVHAGTASLQAPPGTIRCAFSDRDNRNDTLTCQ